MLDRKGSIMSPAGGPPSSRGSRRPRVSRFQDRVQSSPSTLPVGKIAMRTPAVGLLCLQPAGLEQARRRLVKPSNRGPQGPLTAGCPLKTDDLLGLSD
ncbi:hypothetical protein NHX12_013902 [Muraenolepis orangiensis]|uniref:Uncharacterized protein n=1 Tax=Muraenolepis orangiensis TaxID=630683 RepID=A0A9Q0DCJ1_9TELE|nr:hypothetical protein NHX12_013902 [Muraenolepis orangiensis]